MSQSKQGTAVWNGTIWEQLDLVAAVQHNCDCTYSHEGGSVTLACSAHTMLHRTSALWTDCS